MSLRRWVVIGIVGTALAVLSGVVTARAIRPDSRTDAKPDPPLPALYIADGKQDLGEVWETSDAILTVPISNRTDKPIEILDFESSCDCGEISPRRLTVPANGTAKVTVKMDLTGRTPQQIGMVLRKFTLDVRPILTGKSKSPQMPIRFNVKSAITLEHSKVIFSRPQQTETSVRTRKITVTAHEELNSLSVRNTCAGLSVVVKRTSPLSYEVEIGVKSDCLTVDFNVRMEIVAVAKDVTLISELVVSSGGI